MSFKDNKRTPFFPRADAAVLRSKHAPPSERPSEISPILDVDNATRALNNWSIEVAQHIYPDQTDVWAPATIPARPSMPCATDRYLFPVLTRNERLRLTMLYYYTRGALEDVELQSRLQEKVYLAQDTVGWEFVIAGLLNHNTYTRMVTVGLPLAVLPRRESTCAHTVNQPPGAIFTVLNMIDDWRFRESPHVEVGGLRAYAGAPLRFETEYGEHVAFGSLCVASNSVQEPLSKEQQRSLARLADWIVSDIVQAHRVRRQRERRHLLDLLTELQRLLATDQNLEEAVTNMLHQVYPGSLVKIIVAPNDVLHLGDGTSVPTQYIEHGLWEDSDYFDYIIEQLNHQEPVAPKSIRIVTSQCASRQIPTYLVVGTKDFRNVYDDIDTWFVQMCATSLCRYWQNQALKEALQAKETFLRGITHQLRTPIHGILGSVDLLTEELKSRNILSATVESTPDGTPSDEQLSALDPYAYIKTIRSSAKELISTVNSLIKLNQWADVAEAQRVVAAHKIEDIEVALLNELTLFLPDDASVRPSLILNHRFPPRCDTLSLDLRLLIDCIQPLLLNAVQNTAGGVVVVMISVTDDFKSLVVDIEDNGCGIKPDNQQRIFGAYEKVNNHTTDAGLGLTLAVKLATLMNGSIVLVSSEVGRGSHFRLTFNDPTCASSLSPNRRTFSNLPPVFNRLPADDLTSLLGNNFAAYLSGLGYKESQNPSESLLTLDYTHDLAKLYQTTKRVRDDQVAICLVPENDTVINFAGERFLRDNNVIFTKGPFTSREIEDVLAEADAIFATHAAEKAAHLILPGGGITLEPTPPATPAFDPAEEDAGFTAPDLIHRGSIFPKDVVEAELTKSVGALRFAQKPSPPPPRSNKPMTLLVDDNTVNLRLLEMYCKRRGLPYCTATDGVQAVKLFAAHRAPSDATPTPAQEEKTRLSILPTPTPRPFDLVLMDLQMPVCDGIDATSQIRALEKEYGWDKSVVFIVTGQDSPSDRLNAQEAGSDGYLVKPVGPKALDRGIKQWFPDAEVG
ncbi:putative histidine kinase-like protein HHK3p [Boeremia exigua]|uniref:putative histidine kinase-like protein HHK3p n=1 Tax=Boeremia exigua TaxID=749465 RepID=UPI001E8CE8B6|nr:putative histidine kinase-like protein HHK3p [Boeremia exigua]KAH6633410.1 putative histidine kinase-like protein HHK3p [Boeremia exigua]